MDFYSHLDHLSKILQLLKSNQLYAKLSKYEFPIDQIEYLGHIINSEGVATDPTTISAMV
jgi:hypothetical protein